MTQPSPQETKQRFQQALRRAEQLDDRLALAVAHSGLAFAHWQLDTTDLALLHADQAENFALGLASADAAPILRRVAGVYEQIGRIDKAITAYRRALTHFSHNNQSGKTAETLTELGQLLLTHSDYEQALTAILQACQIAHAQSNHALLARCYRQLATLYFEQEAFEQAQLYGQKAIKSAQRSGQNNLIADSYNVVAVLQKYLGAVDSARQLHRSALQLRQLSDDKHGMADSYHNLGILDEDENNFAAAAANYAQALALRQEIGDEAGQLRSYAVLGTVHLAQRKYDLATDYFERALTMAQARGERLIEADILHELATVHAERGDYQHAYQLQQMYAERQRALFNSGRDERLAAIHAQINSGREQRIIEVARNRSIELEARIQQLEAERQRDAARNFDAEMESVDASNEIAALRKINSQVVNMLSHEFRTPLTVIGNATYILERFGKKLSAEKKTDNFNRIKDSLNALKYLLDDIYWIETATATNLSPTPKPTMVYALTDEAIASFTILERDRVKITLPERDVQLNVDGEMVRQVIFQLVANALKFSSATLLTDRPSEPVELAVSYGAGALRIDVRDSGIGIPPSARQQITELFYRAENFQNVRGMGIGLVVVQKYITALNGTLTFDENQPHGTHVTVTLPVETPPIVEAAFFEAARKQILT
jgi:signal transduction histidine kinase